MTAKIDQPEAPAGRSRCKHDMLNGECSWCKGIRDTQPIGASPRSFDDGDRAPRWFPAERHAECAACREPIRPGHSITWSADHAGYVGECCEDAA